MPPSVSDAIVESVNYDSKRLRQELKSSDAILVTLLGALLFVLDVLPGAVYKFESDVRQQAANSTQSLPPAAGYAQYVVSILLVLTTGWLIVKNFNRIAGKRSVAVVGLALGLWVYLLIHTWVSKQEVGLFAPLFPLIVLGIWLSEPPIVCLRVLAVGGTCVAILAIAMGVFFPSRGLYANDIGQMVQSDKGIISGNLLTGPFNSSNNLGQFLVLCLPFLLSMRSKVARVLSAPVICAALIWSGSRSSLIALSAAMLVFGIILAARQYASQILAISIFAVATFCFVVPYWFADDPTAFSGRGNIWRVSLSYVRDDPVFGLGPRWFSELAGLRTGLGDRSNYIAFHAHNQLLHFLITGGLLGLFGVFTLLVRISRIAVGLYRTCGLCPALYMVMFWLSGSFELNLGITDRFQFYATSLYPLLIIALGRVPEAHIDSASSRSIF